MSFQRSLCNICVKYVPAKDGNTTVSKLVLCQKKNKKQIINDCITSDKSLYNTGVALRFAFRKLHSRSQLCKCVLPRLPGNDAVTLCVQVPRVFINGNCIGGGSDTKQLHQQGKLLPLIEQCAPCCSASGAEGSGSGQLTK